MSAADESWSDAEAREFAGLAHALSRSALRARALGRRVYGARAPVPERAAIQPLPVSLRTPPAQTASVPARKLSDLDLHHEERFTMAPPKIPLARPGETVQATSDRARLPAASAHPGQLSPAKSALDVQLQAANATTLDELRARVAACEACTLCQTRTQTVFMDGSNARGVVFVGEAPGADEDRTGVPFVGRSGQLLTDIITKGMGLKRAEVAIVNVLKCRPPDNREPTVMEKETCTPWLDRQIEILDPKVIIPLGRHAAMHVLRIEAPLGELRQRVHTVAGRKVVPTFHPSFLLRSPGQKKECWKDIQLAMGIMGLSVDRVPDESG